MRVAVTYDASVQDCRLELLRIGEIVFEDVSLMPGFLFLDTDVPMDEISTIDGVVSVREEYKYSVFV